MVLWGSLRLCQFWWKSIKKCDRESARRRTDRQIHWQTQTDFIICPICYAIAMGQITIIIWNHLRLLSSQTSSVWTVYTGLCESKKNTCISVKITRSSAAAKSKARPSCLVGVPYDISREKICWWLNNHFYTIGHESYQIRRKNAK